MFWRTLPARISALPRREKTEPTLRAHIPDEEEEWLRRELRHSVMHKMCGP